MEDIKRIKTAVLLPPQVKNNGAFADNTYVDTAGFDALRVLFIIGATDAAVGSTLSTTPPLVEECETSGGTYSDVENAELPAAIAATDDDKLMAIDIDLNKAHKRYMRVQEPTAANATGANLCILALLSKKKIDTMPGGNELDELVVA